MKTIDINAKEWFDKHNGNSYFSAQVILDYGTPEQKDILLPFQYGYGDHYMDIANAELMDNGYIPSVRYDNGSRLPLWQYCRDNAVILRKNKKEGCLKKEVKIWGEK